MKTEFLEIIKAEYTGGHNIRLWFNDNTDKEINLYGYLKGEVFEPLKSPEYFRNFTIRYNTIEWPNGADFAPEFLHSL